jgi:HK97 family phage major capsid protein
MSQQVLDAFNQFKAVNDGRLAMIEQQTDKIEASFNRIGLFGGSAVPSQDSAHIKAFVSSMRSGRDSGLAEFQNSMSSGSDPDGGFAVPSQLEKQITELALHACPMEQECEVLNISTPNYTRLVSKRGTTSGWIGETAARPETSTPQLVALTPFMGEIYANPGITQNLLDDNSVNLEEFILNNISAEFSVQENAAYTTGTGIAKPKGLLAYSTAATSDATRDFGVLEHIVTGDAAGFATASATVSPGDCLVNLVYSLKAAYRNGAKWMMNKKTLSVVSKFKDAVDGKYIWSPSLVAGQPSLLLGYPVIENEDFPDIGAGALPIAFGNFKTGFCITKRIGLSMLRDAWTNKPYVHFYTRKRTGSFLSNSECIKILKVSA